MNRPDLQSAVEKEILTADKYLDNLECLPGWRMAAIVRQARFCRDSLEKAFSLNGHTGHWILDTWTYIVTALPLCLPASILVIPALFTALVAGVSGILSFVTMEPKVFETSVTVPFLYFFKVSKTITETVMVPVVHAPDVKVATGVAAAIVVMCLLLLSYTSKYLMLYELRFRRKLLLRRVRIQNQRGETASAQ